MVTYKGQPLRRGEDHRLLRGEGSFVDDIKLSGMLHAAVLRSLHAHARILSLNVSPARDMPGVEAVLTAEETAGVIKDIAPAPRPGILDMRAPNHPILARDKVCYVGQPVAIVVARDRYLARDALDLIQVEYDPLPPIMDPMEAAQDSSTPIHDSLGTNVALRVHEGQTDLDAIFAQAAHVIQERYEVPRLSAVPLEGRALIAQYDPQEQALTLWTSTQSPHTVKAHLEELLDVPLRSVRVIAPDVGGGFGQKHEIWPEEIAISYLAVKLGQPIKWIEDRMENMVAYHGRGFTADAETAVTGDGTVLAMRIRIVADVGAYFLHSTAISPINAAHRVAGPYHVPQLDVSCMAVITNKPPVGPYRGAGGPEAAFITERTMDLIARDLDLDPVEVRRRNFIPPEAFPYTTITGLTYDSGNFAAAMDMALEQADYYGWRAKQQSQDPSEPLIGIGVATVVKASGGVGPGRTSNARLVVEPTGQVNVYTEVSPHGQGTETSFAQIAADALGVRPQDVRVLHGDTDMLPSGQGTFASRGLTVGGSAVHVGAQEARDKLALIAAHLLGCSPEYVEIRDGTAFNREDREQALAFSEVAAAAYRPDLLPDGMEPGLDFSGSFTLPENPFGFAAHVVVVQVDRGTGDVRFLRFVAVHDSGRIINPMIIEGQLQGGIAQGIGQALGEGMLYSEDGQPLTGSLMDYALPSVDDIPEIDMDSLETPSPTNPLGIKGVGELPTVAAPVAVANAVLDALASAGVRHLDVPLTPEKVWRGLQQGRTS